MISMMWYDIIRRSINIIMTPSDDAMISEQIPVCQLRIQFTEFGASFRKDPT